MSKIRGPRGISGKARHGHGHVLLDQIDRRSFAGGAPVGLRKRRPAPVIPDKFQNAQGLLNREATTEASTARRG